MKTRPVQQRGNTVYMSVRARAFDGDDVPVKHEVTVDIDTGAVRVWDGVAGFYTTNHCLSDWHKVRLLNKARDYAIHQAIVRNPW